MIAGRLVRHPDSPPAGVEELTVVVERLGPELLFFRFTVVGNLASLRLPDEKVGERRDELWRHTCFEAFLGAEDRSYVELNLAPSGDWAAYRFDDYRRNMRWAALSPLIDVRKEESRFELRAAVRVRGLDELPAEAAWRMGASAVIEDAAGQLSYWGLAHPPGAPDFHNRDCFALTLPPAQPT